MTVLLFNQPIEKLDIRVEYQQEHVLYSSHIRISFSTRVLFPCFYHRLHL